MTVQADVRAFLLPRIIGGQSPAEARLRVHVARAPALGGHTLAAGEIVALLDELEVPLSRRAACKTLIDAGLAEPDGDGLRIATELPEEVLTWLPAEIRPDKVETAEIAKWMAELEGKARDSTHAAPELRVAVEVIGRAAGWAATIAHEAKLLGLAGLPVFWIERTDGEGYRPETRDVGSVATVDGLLMVLNGLKVNPVAPERLRTAAVQLTDCIVQMQRTSDDWYDGAQVTPMWDDDFVGTLTAEHSELGPCPTLDATACMATGLAQALASTVARDLRPSVRDALERAVRCILRWQEPDGSWAVHRYNVAAESWQMPPRTLSIFYAVEAMASARAYVDVDLGNAPHQALAFLRRTARVSDTDVHWTLDFLDEPSEGDLGATALLMPTVAALGELCGKDVGDLVVGAAEFLRSRWRPKPGAPLIVSFRVPTWAGPALDRFQWELPLDPIVVSALLADERAGGRLDLKDRGQLANAVGSFLARCHPGGFWVDLLKEAEGDVQGMTGNSDFFQKAVLDYVYDQCRFCSGRSF